MAINRTALLQARAKAGLSQKALADKAKVSQQLIGALEKGKVNYTKYVFAIASALDISPEELDDDIHAIQPGGGNSTEPSLPTSASNRPDVFPVYGARVEKGGVVRMSDAPVSFEPYAGAGTFGVLVPDRTMSPRFEPGEILEISYGHPLAPGYDVVVFDSLTRARGGKGDAFLRKLVVGKLRDWDDSLWSVEQLTPPRTLTLPRDHWEHCARIVGHRLR